VRAHHDVPAFAETSMKPYPNFLTKLFLFDRGKCPRSYWWIHTIAGGYQRGGLGENWSFPGLSEANLRVLEPRAFPLKPAKSVQGFPNLDNNSQGQLGFQVMLGFVMILLSYHHMDYFFLSTQPLHSRALPPSFPFVIAHSAIHAFLVS
jgi:hypothetical protein